MNISFENIDQCSDSEQIVLSEKLAKMDPWLRLGYTQEEIHRHLANPDADARHLVIRKQERIVGALCLKYPWLHGVYIGLFAVLPDAQGEGIGSRTLDFIEREYGGKTTNIWLLVSGFNESAQDFYRTRGFKAIGAIEDFLVKGEDEMLMRKVVS